MQLTIIGAGPAGSAAALAALLAGAQVDLHEKSRFPKHKVCGEFISPEMLPLLERLGVLPAFIAARPAPVHRLEIRFGARLKVASLPETAYGLSRFAFDKLLFEHACGAGAVPHGAGKPLPGRATVVAGGRNAAGHKMSRGRRLFGFKAHFRGPAADGIELHFFKDGYAGINPVENGLTNVCGLAAESALARVGFEYEELLGRVPSLAERLRPLEHVMDWLSTGPLVFANHLNDAPLPDLYHAGDALSFVDPFTGSGMYCAVLTGVIAGNCAARGLGPAQHIGQCRRVLGRSFAFSSIIRSAIAAGWAQGLAPFIPARWLYRLTRPPARSAPVDVCGHLP